MKNENRESRIVLLAGLAIMLAGSPAAGQVISRLHGTSRNPFIIDTLGATPLSLTNAAGALSLSGGLTVSAGTINFNGATVANLGSITTCDINGGTIDGVTIGGTTPAAGTFTTLTASGGTLGGMAINSSTIGATTRSTGAFTSLAANNGLTVSAGTITFNGATVTDLGSVTTCDINGGTLDGVTIGGATPAAGSFTAVTASGQITSTIANGTAPLVVSSSTKVQGLNAQLCNGFVVSPGYNGGVLYRNTSNEIDGSAAGTAGQFLASGGASAPTWSGLSSGKIWIGSLSNLPAAQSMTGAVTITNAGVTSIADYAISGNNIASAVADYIMTATLTAGTEASDVIRVAMQLKDAHGDNGSGTYLVHWHLSDSELGSTVTTQSPTVSYFTGTEWSPITTNKKAIARTSTSGNLAIDVTLSGTHTIYFCATCQDRFYTTTLAFN